MNREQLHELGVDSMMMHTASMRWEMDPDERHELEETGALFNAVMRHLLDTFEQKGLVFVDERELRALEDRPKNFRMSRLDVDAGRPADIFDTGPHRLEHRTLELTWERHHHRYRVVARDPEVSIETV